MHDRPTRVSLRKFLVVLRRRGLYVAGVLVLCVGASLAFSSRTATSYSGEAIFAVPPTSPGQLPPGSPDAAAKLARTYAAALPLDDDFINSVARRAGVGATYVGQHLTVTNDDQTSIIRVSFTSTSSATTSDMLRSAAATLTARIPPAPIVPASIKLLSLPRSLTAASTGARAWILGVLAGLVVAVVLVVALERSENRLDEASDVAALLPVPVTVWSRREPAAAAVALVQRWRSLAAVSPPHVLLAAAGRISQEEAAAVADDLAVRGQAAGYSVVRARSHVVDGRLARIGTIGTQPNSAAAAEEDQRIGMVIDAAALNSGHLEAAALRSDVVVCVLRLGERASTIENLVRRLSHYGAEPTWAIVVRDSPKALLTPDRGNRSDHR